MHTFERHWERWRPKPQQRWKENDVLGGGLLLDLGPHLVDSATQLFGPVVSVYAETRALSTPTEDDVFLVLHHAAPGSKPGAVPGRTAAADVLFGVEPPAKGVVSRLWAGSLVGAPGPRTRVLGDGGAYLVNSFEGDASPFDVLDGEQPEGTHGWLVRGRERTAVPQPRGGHARLLHRRRRLARGRGRGTRGPRGRRPDRGGPGRGPGLRQGGAPHRRVSRRAHPAGPGPGFDICIRFFTHRLFDSANPVDKGRAREMTGFL